MDELLRNSRTKNISWNAHNNLLYLKWQI
jgi:hypothetical protein